MKQLITCTIYGKAGGHLQYILNQAGVNNEGGEPLTMLDIFRFVQTIKGFSCIIDTALGRVTITKTGKTICVLEFKNILPEFPDNPAKGLKQIDLLDAIEEEKGGSDV